MTGLAVAIVHNGVALSHCRGEGRDQAATLLPAVAAVLSEAGVDRRQLTMIAVTVGPGSFTGVRVGLATARGLAIALGVPLAGFPTTSVLLAQAPATDRLVVAAIDSKLGDWFCAVAEDDRAPFLASSAALAIRLRGRPSLIVGPQANALMKSLADASAQQVPIDAVTLANLALSDGVETWRARNAAEGLPRPLYLRGVNVTSPDGSRRTVE